MEEYKEDNNNKKRVRDESALGSPESKLARVDSCVTVVSSNSAGSDFLEPDPDDLDVHSPEVKRMQEDLLNILDESDPNNEPDPGMQGLDSFIKSFEEEILLPGPAPGTGESQPELGYLLEASDDELGLPPSFTADAEPKAEAVDFEAGGEGAVAFGDILGFDDNLPSYDSFELGMVGNSDLNGDNGSNDFVALGGLFDYTDRSFEPTDGSEFSYRTETLPAL